MNGGYSPLRRQVREWRREYYNHKVLQLEIVIAIDTIQKLVIADSSPEEAAALWDAIMTGGLP